MLSFLQMLILAIGETDYEGLFEGNKEDQYWFTVPAHILYASFLVLVTIVFMNLLIGLSVSDIEVGFQFSICTIDGFQKH